MSLYIDFQWKTIEAYGTLILFIALFGFFSAMIFAIGLDHSFWGDEGYFVATIRHFGENLTPSLLADYGEVTGPLFM